MCFLFKGVSINNNVQQVFVLIKNKNSIDHRSYLQALCDVSEKELEDLEKRKDSIKNQIEQNRENAAHVGGLLTAEYRLVLVGIVQHTQWKDSVKLQLEQMYGGRDEGRSTAVPPSAAGLNAGAPVPGLVHSQH